MIFLFIICSSFNLLFINYSSLHRIFYSVFSQEYASIQILISDLCTLVMSLQRFRQEEHIADLQFVVLEKIQQKQTQLNDLLSVLKLAIVQFRLQNFQKALNYHLFAVGLTGSQKNLHLINSFLVLDYLALGDIKQAAKIFVEYLKIQMGKPVKIFQLQIYCKLNYFKQFIGIYLIVQNRQDGEDFHKIISCIWLIQLNEKNVNNGIIKCPFQRACSLLLKFKKIDCRNFYKLFQAAYFLLRFSYRKGRFDYRDRLKDKIWSYLKFIEKNLGPAISNPLLNQLKTGREYDICLLYVDS